MTDWMHEAGDLGRCYVCFQMWPCDAQTERIRAEKLGVAATELSAALAVCNGRLAQLCYAVTEGKFTEALNLAQTLHRKNGL